ncbi:hypothetical protein HMN09_00021400 [Mycena chlorophos]|uniref:Tyrosine-protein kinase ephrin type A/B receptor-like domain-containing protein n=1 Tax=Mycena chlorophos TaxID=658473 RepID=A0A8H6TR22_MYCCL|nr:hypothetical protein HMN09_00021400 [Mycena chlorophos]
MMHAFLTTFATLFLAATTTMTVHAAPAELDSRQVICPAGSYSQYGGCTTCSEGTYQPATGQSSCLPAPAGNYVPYRNATAFLPCYVGSYQPYTGQAFCYGAPSGRFQNLTGQAGVCGACCGWATLQSNYNTYVYKCSGSTPFSGRASGSGCVSTRQGCDPVATCVQGANGTCPDQTFN